MPLLLRFAICRHALAIMWIKKRPSYPCAASCTSPPMLLPEARRRSTLGFGAPDRTYARLHLTTPAAPPPTLPAAAVGQETLKRRGVTYVHDQRQVCGVTSCSIFLNILDHMLWMGIAVVYTFPTCIRSGRPLNYKIASVVSSIKNRLIGCRYIIMAVWIH
jgi:hypothetical protein